MKKTVWHKGPPPEIGWWPASTHKDEIMLSWWNGEYWSNWAYCHYSAKLAAYYAAQKDIRQKEIEWTERWWLK